MYKQNSEFKSIQKKLVGAVAMVLVACIMVVSSSYAWFTLSTAPEVTGIQTSVGSNGNLEMALRDPEFGLNEITTTSQTSMPTANKYWGNLVDLSDASYGLNKIVLKPSRLSWSNANGNKINSTYLQTPKYGVDGRISGWDTVLSGKLSNDQFEVDNDYVGVRGLGTVSGLSAGQIALRDAVSAMTNARDAVTSMAKRSLEEDAINLANLIIANQMRDKETVTTAEWEQVTAAVANLKAIAVRLESTMDTVVSAVAVAQNVDMTGADIAYTASGATVTKGGVAVDGLTLPDDLQAGLGKASATLTSMNSLITAAEGVIGKAEAGEGGESTSSFDTVERIMTSILSVSDIRVDGQELSGKQLNDIVSLVTNAYTNNNGKLPINIVQGIYTDVADFIGVYSAQKLTTIDVDGSPAESLFPDGVTVTLQMKVETPAPVIKDGVNQYYLSYFVTQLNLLEAHDAGGNTQQIISDLYAFAVDMAFRTNAAASKLMLQTAAASRVGDDTTAGVQGGGSYMEFTKGADDERYTIEQMRNLMSAVRVVLYNTETMEICGIAALDMTAAETDGDVVKAPLYLHSFTLNSDNSLELGDRIAAGAAGNEEGTANKSVLATLVQNQAFALTALVYLDGDEVENADVATAGNSMTGTLNLQFSSSAELKPMDYTFAETPTEAPTTPTGTTPTEAPTTP